MMKGLLEHVVAACGKASLKESGETYRISALLYPELPELCYDPLFLVQYSNSVPGVSGCAVQPSRLFAFDLEN
jgi:hypothetical protein